MKLIKQVTCRAAVALLPPDARTPAPAALRRGTEASTGPLKVGVIIR